MGKKRCEIDAEFKWNITDLIKDEEEYEKNYTEVNMLANKIKSMQGSITLNAQNLQIYLDTALRLDYLLEKIYVYSYLYISSF